MAPVLAIVSRGRIHSNRSISDTIDPSEISSIFTRDVDIAQCKRIAGGLDPSNT